jgi:predicted PurR-regulated permease PerM
MRFTDAPPTAGDFNPITSGSATPSAPEVRRRASMLVVLAAVLVAIALSPLAVGLASALVLYELCERPYAWTARRIRPGVAAALIACAMFAAVIGPLLWLGRHLSVRLPAVLAAFSASRAPQSDGSVTASATGLVARLQAQFAGAGNAISDWLPGVLPSIAQNTTWALLNWSIALLGLYYLLDAAPTSWGRFARALPLSPVGVETLRVRFRDVTRGIVAGSLLSAAVQGAAIGVGFRLAGVPDALFWGACAAIATLVPVVGNALVWVPALLLVILRQQYQGAIAIGVFGGLLPGVIDRVVRANVSRRVGSVHPMITLVGVLAGMRIAGVAGLILGPVALAMFFALIEIYDKEYVGYSEGSRPDGSQSPSRQQPS